MFHSWSFLGTTMWLFWPSGEALFTRYELELKCLNCGVENTFSNRVCRICTTRNKKISVLKLRVTWDEAVYYHTFLSHVNITLARLTCDLVVVATDYFDQLQYLVMGKFPKQSRDNRCTLPLFNGLQKICYKIHIILLQMQIIINYYKKFT